jgi:hypothetical protein
MPEHKREGHPYPVPFPRGDRGKFEWLCRIRSGFQFCAAELAIAALYILGPTA